VIGVLIRQSDTEWTTAALFYHAQYSAWMRQLLALHNAKVRFIVASEERQDHACCRPSVHQATATPGGRAWFENWAELSLCDFVGCAEHVLGHGGVPWRGALWPSRPPTNHGLLQIHGRLAGAARHPVFSRSVK